MGLWLIINNSVSFKYAFLSAVHTRWMQCAMYIIVLWQDNTEVTILQKIIFLQEVCILLKNLNT
jgi:hypothetical protein